jgi:hypothetical protein
LPAAIDAPAGRQSPGRRGHCLRASHSPGYCKVAGLELICSGIALNQQPLTATQYVLPELTMRAFYVIEQEDIVVPRVQVRQAMSGSDFARVTAITELRVVTFTA